jgi:hypothetical protein
MRGKPLRLLLVALALALASGCASVPLQYASLSVADGEAASAELHEVPFHPQDAYQCGPAALATVMNHAGLAILPEQLTPQVYLPGRQGSLQTELLAAVRRHGFVAYVHEPKLTHLLDEVRAGHPVLVLQNLGLARWPVWHYAVVVGFDLNAQEVVLRSGTTKREVLSLRRFEQSWRLGDYWALTLHPPGTFPAHADEARYLAAVAPLERVGRRAEAEASYAASAERWPSSYGARIGLGNARYLAGDYAAAEQHYRAAASSQPERPAAHHNLAWALMRQGRTLEAREHAERAAGLAGAAQAHYRAALEALQD